MLKLQKMQSGCFKKTLFTSAGDCLVHRLRKDGSDERVID